MSSQIAKTPLLPLRGATGGGRVAKVWDLLLNVPAFAFRILRLVAFVVLLLPAFVVFVWHYATCDRIAVYYGGRRRWADEDNGEKDNSGSCEKIGVCNGNGATNGEKMHKRYKSPFFSRHYLDIYGSRTPLPSETNAADRTDRKPVVVFLTGGAWIIGYRMWGTLLGRALAPFGILCIVPDYRNFPQVNVQGMVQDVDMSIQWVIDHVEEYGGDKEKIVLVGQSAGAHIGGVVVTLKVWDWLCRERCVAESSAKGNRPAGDQVQGEWKAEMSPLKSTYSPEQIRGFISTSSPMNLITMRPVLHHHGLSASLQKSIFGGLGDDQTDMGEDEDYFKKWSPYHIILKCHSEYVKLMKLNNDMGSDGLEFKDIFPRFCVIHGTADNTVPISEAEDFVSLISKLQMHTEVKLYEGWSHTDPILEAPMCGDHTYHRDIYEMVFTWTGEKPRSKTFDKRHPMMQPICPTILVEAARFCNPF